MGLGRSCGPDRANLSGPARPWSPRLILATRPPFPRGAASSPPSRSSCPCGAPEGIGFPSGALRAAGVRPRRAADPSTAQNPPDELRLPRRVLLPVRHLPSQPPLHLGIFLGQPGIRPQRVPESELCLPPGMSFRQQMQMRHPTPPLRVRQHEKPPPRRRDIQLRRHETPPARGKHRNHRRDRLRGQVSHRGHHVEHRFGRQAGHRRRADVFYLPAGEPRREPPRELRAQCGAPRRPRRIRGMDCRSRSSAQAGVSDMRAR